MVHGTLLLLRSNLSGSLSDQGLNGHLIEVVHTVRNRHPPTAVLVGTRAERDAIGPALFQPRSPDGSLRASSCGTEKLAGRAGGVVKPTHPVKVLGVRSVAIRSGLGIDSSWADLAYRISDVLGSKPASQYDGDAYQLDDATADTPIVGSS